MDDLNILIASEDTHWNDGITLFKAYAASLNFDLSFQGFEKELEEIKLQYNEPNGVLVLVYDNNKPIGCAGLRKINDDESELKRMYILPKYQGRSIGKQIMELIIVYAKKLNYKKIKLDTLASMIPAIKLYKSYGFVETEAYRFNPFEDAVYMELAVN